MLQQIKNKFALVLATTKEFRYNKKSIGGILWQKAKRVKTVKKLL